MEISKPLELNVKILLLHDPVRGDMNIFGTLLTLVWFSFTYAQIRVSELRTAFQKVVLLFANPSREKKCLHLFNGPVTLLKTLPNNPCFRKLILFEHAMWPNSQTNYSSALLIRTLLMWTEDRPKNGSAWTESSESAVLLLKFLLRVCYAGSLNKGLQDSPKSVPGVLRAWRECLDTMERMHNSGGEQRRRKEEWKKEILTFRHRAHSIYYRRFADLQRTLFIYLINKYISLSDICLTLQHWYK